MDKPARFNDRTEYVRICQLQHSRIGRAYNFFAAISISIRDVADYMNYQSLRVWICLAGIMSAHGVSYAQEILSGMVADSASMQPLPNVNVLNKQTGNRAVTDIRGSFAITAGEGDTIVFSRVGYHSKALPFLFVKEVVIVFLKEEHRMLEPVEIGKQNGPSWLPELPPESPWKNPTYERDTDAPGVQGIQTFGPGYVFRMPGSGFKKEARAKKRLADVEEENDKAREYIHLVNGPEIKGRVMKEQGISEREFYRLLAIFNERNKEFLYKLDNHEVVPLLLQFFAEEGETR